MSCFYVTYLSFHILSDRLSKKEKMYQKCNVFAIFLQICRNSCYYCNIMQDKLITTLKNNGYSLTKTRQALFSALLSGKPRTMRELTLDLASVMDRASIYRTVALFEELGIVVRVQQGWKYKVELSDKFSPHHHHLNCTQCGKILSFNEPAGFEKIINNLAEAHLFHLSGHTLELQGLCHNCQTKPTA